MLPSGHASLITTTLIALALGYIVCSLASKEKGTLKTTGYIIGISIIVISSLLLVSKILKVAGKGRFGSKAKMVIQHRMSMQGPGMQEKSGMPQE